MSERDMDSHEARRRDADLGLDFFGQPRLGRPRIGPPDPALRQRTLNAVRGALAAAPEPGWRAWRLEAALAAAIFACVLLPPVTHQPTPPAAEASRSLDPPLETLGLNGLEPYIQFRLALSRREADPQPRYPGHDISSRTHKIF